MTANAHVALVVVNASCITRVRIRLIITHMPNVERKKIGTKYTEKLPRDVREGMDKITQSDC